MRFCFAQHSKPEIISPRLEGYEGLGTPNTGATTCLSAAQRARKQFGAETRVGSPVDFQREFRKRALRARASSHVCGHPNKPSIRQTVDSLLKRTPIKRLLNKIVRIAVIRSRRKRHRLMLASRHKRII